MALIRKPQPKIVEALKEDMEKNSQYLMFKFPLMSIYPSSSGTPEHILEWGGGGALDEGKLPGTMKAGCKAEPRMSFSTK